MKRYLDPKADLTFKRVFGEHKHLLISLLNALLPLKEDQKIQSIEYLAPEMVPDTPFKKDSIVDVRCFDTHNRSFIVEMQMYWTAAFKHRALFNTAKAVSRQLEAGARFQEMKPVYTLSLVNDIAFPDTPRFYHHYLPPEQTDPTQVIEGFNMIFVELPKFAQWQKQHGSVPASTINAEATISSHTFNRLAVLWCRFLTEINEHTTDVDDALLAESDVRSAIDLIEQSAYTDSERLTYERYWDMVSRERTALDEAEDRGRKEGRAETVIDIARNLKHMGFPLETIIQATGLSPEDIEAL